MIVCNHDILRIALDPAKDNAILVIDPDPMKACPIPFQGFQSVSGWNPQVPKFRGGIEHVKLSRGNSPNRLRNSAGGLSFEPIVDIFSCLIGKVDNHDLI